MPDIWQVVPDSYTITTEQNVRFQVGICFENLNSIKFKMTNLRPLLTLIYVISGILCWIARPLL